MVLSLSTAGSSSTLTESSDIVEKCCPAVISPVIHVGYLGVPNYHTEDQDSSWHSAGTQTGCESV